MCEYEEAKTEFFAMIFFLSLPGLKKIALFFFRKSRALSNFYVHDSVVYRLETYTYEPYASLVSVCYSNTTVTCTFNLAMPFYFAFTTVLPLLFPIQGQFLSVVFFSFPKNNVPFYYFFPQINCVTQNRPRVHR